MKQIDRELDVVDSVLGELCALQAVYNGFIDEGMTATEIDAIFANKYGVVDATEDFGND